LAAVCPPDIISTSAHCQLKYSLSALLPACNSSCKMSASIASLAANMSARLQPFNLHSTVLEWSTPALISCKH